MALFYKLRGCQPFPKVRIWRKFTSKRNINMDTYTLTNPLIKSIANIHLMKTNLIKICVKNDWFIRTKSIFCPLFILTKNNHSFIKTSLPPQKKHPYVLM